MLEMKLGVVALCLASLAGCSRKVTQEQCDGIVSRYAEFVVLESKPDAGPDEIKSLQSHAQTEAKSDDAFRNCTSQIEPADYDCAMKAKTADDVEKCLE